MTFSARAMFAQLNRLDQILRAVADAQQARGVRPRSKAVTLPIAALPAAALRAVRRRGCVTFVIRNRLPPLETIPVLGAGSGEDAAGGPPSPATSTGAPPGEVGISNTQLSCQLVTPSPTDHARVQ
jgi:hypothetical protein